MNNALEPQTETKAQTYAIGAAVGAMVGMVAAYLYGRSVEEGRREGAEVQSLQVGQIIALSLALLGLVRQIAEMGRPAQPKRRR